MSDEKNPSTEESPETRPEVTGEVTTSEDSPQPADNVEQTGPGSEDETAGDAAKEEDETRPEATGEVTVEPETEPTDDPAEPEGQEPAEGESERGAEAEGQTEAKDEPDAPPEEAVDAAEDSAAEEGAGPAEATETAEAEEEEKPDVEASAEAHAFEDAGSEDAPSEDAPSEDAAAKETAAESAAEPEAAPKPKKKRKRKRKKKAGAAGKEAGPVEERPEIAALRTAKKEGTPVEGRVFGWNKGGFHVVVGDVPAFCPLSEMEPDGRVSEPEAYIDQTMEFLILRIQDKGRRIVLSRAALEKREQHRQREQTLKELSPGAVTKGSVTSIVDFGVFVELGGVEGLVHRSELTRRYYDRMEDVVEVGQEVEVKVLKVEKGGRRISLSMKALEPDPWKDARKKFPEGEVVVGTVEHTAAPGAFIELEPGLTGLLPTSEMNIPREAIPARIFPPGKEVKVVVMSLDPRRKRISLALEGSKPGASHKELTEFRKSQQQEEAGFGALAAAFAKLGNDEE